MATLRLSVASGATGNVRAGESLGSLAAIHGLILVELRDGSFRASGRLILP
jgi:hypothetical protein